MLQRRGGGGRRRRGGIQRVNIERRDFVRQFARRDMYKFAAGDFNENKHFV